jgi:hypothetical protein
LNKKKIKKTEGVPVLVNYLFYRICQSISFDEEKFKKCCGAASFARAKARTVMRSGSGFTAPSQIQMHKIVFFLNYTN